MPLLASSPQSTSADGLSRTPQGTAEGSPLPLEKASLRGPQDTAEDLRPTAEGLRTPQSPTAEGLRAPRSADGSSLPLPLNGSSSSTL